MDDVIINKIQTINRCLARIDEEFAKQWRVDFTIQDALLLNIERACQATIDLAAYQVKSLKLGIPQSSRDVFEQLASSGFISEELSQNHQNIVGFRNLAVYEYAKMNLDIVEEIVKHELQNLIVFSELFKR